MLNIYNIYNILYKYNDNTTTSSSGSRGVSLLQEGTINTQTIYTNNV